MRFLSVFIIILCILLFNPVRAAQKGSVQYTVPVDYSLINESELNAEAENLFQQYIQTQDETQQKYLLNKLVSDYSILGEINKDNPLYFARLGIIFDKLGKDRWAKSNFCRSANIDGAYPYAFYNFGNFFFDRKEYRRALKEYRHAYDNGYSNHFETLYKMGIIYEKLGDYSSAIKYFKNAILINNTEELQSRIQLLEGLLLNNSVYDKSRSINK